MTITAPQPNPELADLKQRWNALNGAGDHARALKGDAFAAALGSAMDAFAQSIAEQFGVEVKELHWQSKQAAQESTGRAS